MRAVILAGGENKRMGRNKAFVKLNDGSTVIENQIRLLRKVFAKVLIVANSPRKYQSLGVEVVQDIIPFKGPLGGIYSGLFSPGGFYNFFLACDAPFPNMALIAYMKGLVNDYDVVVPKTRFGYEPLSAFYSRDCLSSVKRQMDSGNLKVVDFFPGVRVRVVEGEELNRFDPEGIAFFNINTREDLRRARRIAVRHLEFQLENRVDQAP